VSAARILLGCVAAWAGKASDLEICGVKEHAQQNRYRDVFDHFCIADSFSVRLSTAKNDSGLS